MNSILNNVRKRNQTLLIVEGHHEKNKLFWLIFKTFPEIGIDMDNIWIYGTNIYMLYNDIEKEYGKDWLKEDIDLPYVISKKKSRNGNDYQYKKDFTDIILVFDYERHDDNFSEQKIEEMQSCFSDSTDMGKLYINYPMIESYRHIISLPDKGYLKRKIPVSLQPGKKYKQLVKDESAIEKAIDFPLKIDDLMNKHFGITDKSVRNTCCENILHISDKKNLEGRIKDELTIIGDDIMAKKLKYQLIDWICKLNYIDKGQSYWQYIRELFIEIIHNNILKAKCIQENQNIIADSSYKEIFHSTDLVKVLSAQNQCSRNKSTGFIWVLNTSIFFVADYNFSLVQKNYNN